MKDQFLLDPNATFLNHGSFGACPRVVFKEYQNWQRRLEFQPGKFMTHEVYHYLKEARDDIGKFLNCNGDDLLFFPNPTTAVSNVINSLQLSEGDEILMTQHEYGALVRSWRASAKKIGLTIRQQQVSNPVTTRERFVKEFWSGVNRNTRVIFISHITSSTALIFPVEEICKLASKAGILTIIDGAHVPGQIPLDISSLNCDFYTGACHKWLCAPKGVSFLYIKENHHGQMRPLVVSWGEEGDDPGPTELLKNFQWQGTRDMSAFLTIPAAIRFRKDNQWSIVQENCKELVKRTADQLQQLLNTEPIFHGSHWLGQMVSHPLPTAVPSDLKLTLWNDHQIEVPVFQWQDRQFIRVSIQCYNTWTDVERLIYALKTLLS